MALAPRPARRKTSAPGAISSAAVAVPPALQNVVDRLNPEQRAAVTTLAGPLLVLAGAGSGKTRVITVRIAWLLAHGAAPEQLLAMTFTNRAAAEMRERAAALCGGEAAKAVTIGTFHSFCVRLLRERGHAIGLPSRFAICDGADQLTALKGALRELRVAETAIHPGALQSQISLMKSRLVSPQEAYKAAEGRRELLIARSYAKYDECLRRQRMVDFDDLLLLAVKLLRESAADRAALAERFRFVMVDEYQDTNAPQYELLRLIAGEHRNLCVVGDDDQSIYGWRGADVKKILGFERDFAGAKVVRLETNYRSTEPILEAANRVIACNPDRHGKTLRSALGAGEPVVVKRVEDETAEADLAVREITERMRDGLSRPGDFAILFRAATQARAFEAALRAKQVPYRLIGGMSFFDRKEVRDVLAYLRLATNPDDEVSLLRVINCPPRGIGKSTIDKALDWATREGIPVARAFRQANAIAGLPGAAVESMQGFLDKMGALGRLAGDDAASGRDLVAWIRRVLAETDYRAEVDRAYPEAATREERWQGVLELVNFAENHCKRSSAPTLQSFLEALTLSAEDTQDEEKEKARDVVTLMTLHSAKGLEFPRVWLVGCEEGLLPHVRAVTENTVEEERRLMYVGITRAQRHLTITCVKSRARGGHRGESMPSRFLYEMRGEAPPKMWRPCEPREE